jgi:hypothetical protein
MTFMRSSSRGRKRSSENAVGWSWAGFSSASASALPAPLSSGECRMETYEAADSATMSLISRSSSSAPFLTESSESAASYVFGSGVFRGGIESNR